MINKQETEHEEIKKLFTNKGSYNNDSTDYPSAINYDYSYDGSSNISIPTGISSLEGEVYEELIERQKSSSEEKKRNVPDTWLLFDVHKQLDK